MEYQKLDLSSIPDIFLREEKGNKVVLRYGKAREIIIDSPFYLDEDVARMFGMLFDGSLSKDLNNIMFSQKKDPSKMHEVAKIIYKKFGINPKIEYRENGDLLVRVSNKTLCVFLYHCLDFYKCDEPGRLPKWLYLANIEVKRDFLRYAFAMEGSIDDPNLMDKEIRFHNCDYDIIVELKNFIKRFFDVDFKITKYYVKDYGEKYYLNINDIENIRKFSKIGFALESHESRLKEVLKLHHSKSWEITLVALFKTNKRIYSFKDVHDLFPYLKSSGAIRRRLNKLLHQKYLEKNGDNYILTKVGFNKAKEIENFVNINKIRTYSKENEELVLDFLRRNKKYWVNGVSRGLKIHRKTIQDTIRRLISQNRVKFFHKDKFQRKFYEIK